MNNKECIFVFLYFSFFVNCSSNDASSDGRGDSQKTNICGDGVVDTNESCDDGSSNSDIEANSCRVNCTFPSCGDGVVDTSEECDDGSNNSDIEIDSCRTNCTSYSCGDGVVDTNENCDDGISNSDIEANSCRVNCTFPSCGDGVVDTNENCDDGSSNSDIEANSCRMNCTFPSCGDGVVDTSEECDRGEENTNTTLCSPNNPCTFCTLQCTEIKGQTYLYLNELEDIVVNPYFIYQINLPQTDVSGEAITYEASSDKDILRPIVNGSSIDLEMDLDNNDVAIMTVSSATAMSVLGSTSVRVDIREGREIRSIALIFIKETGTNDTFSPQLIADRLRKGGQTNDMLFTFSQGKHYVENVDVYGFYELPDICDFIEGNYSIKDTDNFIPESINLSLYDSFTVVIQRPDTCTTSIRGFAHTEESINVNGTSYTMPGSYLFLQNYTNRYVFQIPLSYELSTIITASNDKITNFENIFVHEYLHSQNILSHSYNFICDTDIFYGENCENWAYGNRFCIMGSRTYAISLSAYWRYYLNWLDDSQVINIIESGTYTLKTLNSRTGQVLGIIRRPFFEDIFVEYRQADEFDHALSLDSLAKTTTQGLLLYRDYGAIVDVTPESFQQSSNQPYPKDADIALYSPKNIAEIGLNFTDISKNTDGTLSFTVEISDHGIIRSNPTVDINPCRYSGQCQATRGTTISTENYNRLYFAFRVLDIGDPYTGSANLTTDAYNNYHQYYYEVIDFPFEHTEVFSFELCDENALPCTWRKWKSIQLRDIIIPVDQATGDYSFQIKACNQHDISKCTTITQILTIIE